MKSLWSRLLLAFLFAAASAHAGGAPETLVYEGNGASFFTWLPSEGVEVRVTFRIQEIRPDSTQPGGKVWRTPSQLQPHPLAQRGSELTIEQNFAWSQPGPGGKISLIRRPESIDTRLVIRDSWRCEPTDDAFFTHEFRLDLTKFPDATLELVGSPAGIEPVSPRVADLIGPGKAPFSNTPAVNVSGVRIGGVAGGILKITLAEPLELTLHTNTAKTEARLRFMSPAPRETLVSGESIMTAEWSPVSR